MPCFTSMAVRGKWEESCLHWWSRTLLRRAYPRHKRASLSLTRAGDSAIEVKTLLLLPSLHLGRDNLAGRPRVPPVWLAVASTIRPFCVAESAPPSGWMQQEEEEDRTKVVRDGPGRGRLDSARLDNEAKLTAGSSPPHVSSRRCS
jgi:hypothetical protein